MATGDIPKGGTRGWRLQPPHAYGACGAREERGGEYLHYRRRPEPVERASGAAEGEQRELVAGQEELQAAIDF